MALHVVIVGFSLDPPVEGERACIAGVYRSSKIATFEGSRFLEKPTSLGEEKSGSLKLN